MKLTTQEDDGVVVLRIEQSRVDAHSAGELGRAITGLFAAAKSKVLVDLSQVDFMDSSGLAALITGHKSASASGFALRLAGLRPQVKSIIELTRLHRVFEIFPTVEQALQNFRGMP